MSYEEKELSLENTFTDWIPTTRQINLNHAGTGFLNFSIAGTWVGTLTVQKRYNHAEVYTDPIVVETYTENTAKLIEDHSNIVEYRIGFVTGSYTSGTAKVRLEQ